MVLPMGASRVARIALRAPSGPELAATLGTAGRDPQRVTPHLRTLRRPPGKREPHSAGFPEKSSEPPEARTSSNLCPSDHWATNHNASDALLMPPATWTSSVHSPGL